LHLQVLVVLELGGIPPTAVHFEDDSDVLGIVIPLTDPAPGSPSVSVTWPVSASQTSWLRSLSAAIRQAQSVQTK
jgi:hypothetical protein